MTKREDAALWAELAKFLRIPEDVLRDDGSGKPIKIGAEAAIGFTRSRLARFEEALRRIASFDEGPVVTGRFDEPASAEIARAALLAEGEKP